MPRLFSTVIRLSLSLLLLAPLAAAAPQPEPVPTRWEFEFRPGDLRVAIVDGDPYLYLTYRVVNFTGRDRIFAPAFFLTTDQGTLLPAGRGVPREVTDTIMDRLEDPLLEDQLSIVDTLLQGIENARFGIVIWPLENIDVDEVRIFAAGFSGETTDYFTINPETGRRERHTLRKTMMLTYRIPGLVESDFGAAPLDLAAQRWVMR